MNLADRVIHNLEAEAASNEWRDQRNKAAQAWREMRHRFQQQDREQERKETTNMADRDTKNPSPTPPPTQ